MAEVMAPTDISAKVSELPDERRRSPARANVTATLGVTRGYFVVCLK
jgi:hypothetical protein